MNPLPPGRIPPPWKRFSRYIRHVVEGQQTDSVFLLPEINRVSIRQHRLEDSRQIFKGGSTMTLQTFATQHQCQMKIDSADAESPAINIEALMSRCMNKRPFASMLLGELETSGMQQVDTILLHFSAKDPLAAAETAHALKGAAAIVGAELLRQTAAEIEAIGRDGQLAPLEDLIPQLRSEMARCICFISTFQNATH